jgi:alanine dehydrogenase
MRTGALKQIKDDENRVGVVPAYVSWRWPTIRTPRAA